MSFLESTLMAAFISAFVTIALPFISARIKRRENGRINELALSVREIEAGREMREELRARVAELEERDHVREHKILELRAALLAVQDDVEDIRSGLQAHLTDHPELHELARRAVQMEERIRRGLGLAG